MRTLTTTLLLAFLDARFSMASVWETIAKPKPEQPVAQWIQAVRTSDQAGFHKVWSDEIHRNIEAFNSFSKGICKEFLALHAKLWVDGFWRCKE